MKEYPIFKESGYIWIGSIPESWNVKKIKHNTYVKGRIGWQGLLSTEYDTVGPYLVTGTDFKNGRINWNSCHHVSERRYQEDPFIQLKENDLLITKDGTIGKIALVDKLDNKATLNSGVFLIRPLIPDYIPSFMLWVLNSNIFDIFINYTSTGSTIQHLYQKVFSEFSFPLPSISEQQKIAKFLYHKISLIDKLIDKKKEKISLLNEFHSATINNILTRGLIPNAQLKDSRIDWVSKIPISWSTPKLSFVANVSNGSTPSRNVAGYWEEGTIPWLSSGKVNDYIVREPSEMITEKALKECSVSLYPIGTVIVGMIGEGKTRGMSAYLEIAACINQNIAGIIPYKKLNGRYLHLFFVNFYERIRELGRGANQPALNCDIVSKIRVLLPPIEEQIEIIQYLDNFGEKIGNAIAKINSEIELLSEYRMEIISAVVTGKIDVREETL